MAWTLRVGSFMSHWAILYSFFGSTIDIGGKTFLFYKGLYVKRFHYKWIPPLKPTVITLHWNLMRCRKTYFDNFEAKEIEELPKLDLDQSILLFKGCTLRPRKLRYLEGKVRRNWRKSNLRGCMIRERREFKRLFIILDT